MEKAYRFLKVLIAVLLVCVAAAGIWAMSGNKPVQEEQTYPVEPAAPETTAAATEATTEATAEATTEANTEATEPPLAENPNRVPDFIVVDQNGQTCHLYDFLGKPIIVNFWASWCGPCKAEMPDFEEAYQQYGEDIHFLMVNVWDTVEEGSAFIQKAGYTFPIYYDQEGMTALAYEIEGIPTTYFLDADGVAVFAQIGMLDEQTLSDNIQLLLGEE